MNGWKKSWYNQEMDQWARKEKRYVKKKKVRSNRRAAKNAINKQDYDNYHLDNWDDLDERDRQ